MSLDELISIERVEFERSRIQETNGLGCNACSKIYISKIDKISFFTSVINSSNNLDNRRLSTELTLATDTMSIQILYWESFSYDLYLFK